MQHQIAGTIVKTATKMVFATLATCVLATHAWAQDAHEHRFYIAPSFAYTLTPNSRATRDGLGVDLAIGKRLTPFLDLEILGGWTGYKTTARGRDAVWADQKAMGLALTAQPNGANRFSIGGGANLYAFSSIDKTLAGWGAPRAGALFRNLYVHADVRYGATRHQPGPTRQHYNGTLFSAGLGYNVPLHFLFDGALRLQALYRLDQHNQKDAGVHGLAPTNNFDEVVLSVGVRVPLGSNQATAPAEAQQTPAASTVHVVPVLPATPPPAEGAAAGGVPAGGVPGAGGAPNVGGAPAAGGTPAVGGAPAAGGAPAIGGAPPTGGLPPASPSPATSSPAPAAGGAPNAGGAPQVGGAPSSSPAPSTGGAPAGGAPAGGAPAL